MLEVRILMYEFGGLGRIAQNKRYIDMEMRNREIELEYLDNYFERLIMKRKVGKCIEPYIIHVVLQMFTVL